MGVFNRVMFRRQADKATQHPLGSVVEQWCENRDDEEDGVQENVSNPQQIWANFRVSSPETYAAFQKIIDVRPDLAASATEKMFHGRRQIIFKLALPDIETDEAEGGEQAKNIRKIAPIFVGYDCDLAEICACFGADYFLTVGSISDEQAARQVLDLAEAEGYISRASVAGLDGKPRGIMMPGPAGAANSTPATMQDLRLTPR